MITTIDILLKKHSYFKSLSDADRLIIYNLALKALAKFKGYPYSNQNDTVNFTIKNDTILSTIAKIDDIMTDNFADLSEAERLLIYKIVQIRLSVLRENTYHYLIHNSRGDLKESSIISLPITKIIYEIIEDVKQKILSLPIVGSINTVGSSIKEKVLSLPILASIISGEQHIRYIEFPLRKTIETLYAGYFKTKSLLLPIKWLIDDLDVSSKIKSLLLPIQNTVTTIFAGHTLEQRNIAMPILATVVTYQEYQLLEEKYLTLPLTNSISTI